VGTIPQANISAPAKEFETFLSVEGEFIEIVVCIEIDDIEAGMKGQKPVRVSANMYSRQGSGFLDDVHDFRQYLLDEIRGDADKGRRSETGKSRFIKENYDRNSERLRNSICHFALYARSFGIMS